ncbi:portal protein [Vibrio vulnificus]|uniref:portal protein n=1 Tax=Vibrio vulnificus TaxID=672 RepID=UPI0015940B60|nr:hypothetical protein [Vibrio vulnificus]NVC72614.1 hypothetical protein [Vibrio vulnificus]
MRLNLKDKKLKGALDEFQSFVSHSFHNAYFSREERVSDWQDAWKYYRSLLPVIKDAEGNAVHTPVEPVLREVVDSIKPSMLAVFCENEAQAVAFRPQSKLITTEVAQAVNKGLNDIFLRENQGYKQLSDAILEALVTGDAYGKVYLCDEEIADTVNIENWMPVELMMLILQEYPDTDLELFETRNKTIEGQKVKQKSELGSATDTVTEFKTDGEIEVLRIENKVKFDYVPFGEMYVDPIATCIDEARYLCHRTIHTKGELFDRFGINPKEVKSTHDSDKANVEALINKIESADTLTGINESNTSNLKLETLREHASKEDYYTSSIDPMEVSVYLYEHWIYSSLLDKDGKTKFYQVYSVDSEGNSILEINEVESGEHPFVKGEVMSLPDSLYGISTYSLCKKDQDTLTRLNSQIMRNGDNANYRRYIALKGQYDRRSLIDNRPGGVAEVNSMGAIEVFPYHQLPAATNDLYQKIKDNVNQIKGNALGPELGAHMNNVAVGTMAMAVQNMEMQDKTFSKAFALSYVKPLFEKMYKLVKQEKLTINSEDMPVNGGQLLPRPEFVIDVNTANDNARIAGQHMNMLNVINGLPEDIRGEFQSPEHLYNMMSDVYRAMGVEPSKYIPDPADKPEPTPEEQMLAEEARKAEIEMQQLQLNKGRGEVRKLAVEIAKGEAEALKVVEDINRDKEKNAIAALEAKADVSLDQQKLDQQKLLARIDVLETQMTGNPLRINHHTTNKV